MTLKFTPRQGGPRNWERAATIGPDDMPVHLRMTTTGSERIETRDGERVVVDDRERYAEIHAVHILDGQPEKGALLWSGPVGLDAPPLRATCVASGLVDADGQELPLPDWAK